MGTDDFRSWLDNMRALGYEEADIRQALREKGWTERQIDELIGAGPAPVPVTPPPAVGGAELPPPPPVPQVLVAPPVSTAPSGPPPPPAPGAYAAPATRPAPTGSSALAIWALVMGLLSLFLFPTSPITGPLAIIFGAVAISRRRPGQGMSVAGIIMGILALIMLPFWLIMGAGAWTTFKVIKDPTFQAYTRDWKEWSMPATPEGSQGEKKEDTTALNPQEGNLRNGIALLTAVRLPSEDRDSGAAAAGSWSPPTG